MEDNEIVLPSDTTAYTRQEWLTDLIEAVDFTYETTDITSSFIDVNRDSPYIHAIETSLMYRVVDESEQGSGIVDGNEVSGAIIRPTEATQRTFAVDTAIKALGYVGVDTPQKQYKLAAKIGLIDPDKNGKEFTTQEAKNMLTEIKRIAAPLDFEEGVTESVDLLDSVKQFTLADLGENGYSFENDAPAQKENEQAVLNIVKTSKTESLKVSDVIMLPANDLYLGGLVQKIVEIVNVGDDNIQFKTVAPHPSELIGEGGVSSRGKTTIDFTKDFTPAPDVVFLSKEGEVLNDDTSTSQDVSKPEVTITLIENGYNVEIKNKGAYAGATIEYPAISHNVEFNSIFQGLGFQIEIARFELSQKTTVYGKVGGDYSIQPIKLGDVDFPIGASGFFVSGALYLAFTGEGYMTITIDFNTTAGFEYIEDGGVRNIGKITTDAIIKPVEASMKFGVRPALLLSYSIWDLADVGLEAGVGVEASISTSAADYSNICTEAKGYAYLDLVALTEASLLGSFLNATVDISIFGPDNSPYRGQWHYEGGFEDRKQVPKCTKGAGSITGKTVDYSTGVGVVSALTANRGDSSEPLKLDTSISGTFPIQSLYAANYQYKIESAGYVTYNGKMTILKDTLFDLGTIKLVKNGSGSISGIITDALSGASIEGVKLTLFSGADVNAINEVSAEKVTFTGDTSSDSSGQYNIAVDNGYYTLKLEKVGYKTGYVNVTSVTEGGIQNITLNPSQDSGKEIGDLRVVLTWGSTPRDLDSHLCGPTASGSRRFHTYYANKNYSENGKLHAFLDLDDTTSYGPETSTVYDINKTGKYSFYVHNYTNRSSTSSTALSSSGAKVEVYTKEATSQINPDGSPVFVSKLIATYNVPRNKTATLWHVFDYNAATGEIIVRDSMYNLSDPGSVGGARSSSEDTEADIANIMNDLKEKE